MRLIRIREIKNTKYEWVRCWIVISQDDHRRIPPPRKQQSKIIMISLKALHKEEKNCKTH